MRFLLSEVLWDFSRLLHVTTPQSIFVSLIIIHMWSEDHCKKQD